MAESNRPLSQAEIDALLAAIGSPEPASESESTNTEPESASEMASYVAIPTPPTSERLDTEMIQSPELRRIVGLPVSLQVGLGERAITVKSLLTWGIGSQVVLTHRWQAPVPLKINGMLVGYGTVVLVGNNFGIRVSSWGSRQVE